MSLMKWRMKKSLDKREDAALLAADAAGVLTFHVLHDKLGYGQKRLESLATSFEAMEQERQGFIYGWANSLEDQGMNRLKLERTAMSLGGWIARKKKAREHEKYLIVLVMAAFTAIFMALRRDKKVSMTKINQLINHLADAVRNVVKEDVPLVEFAKCLDVECNVQCDVLIDYEKNHPNTPIQIYGEYGKKWYKEETR